MHAETMPFRRHQLRSARMRVVRLMLALLAASLVAGVAGAGAATFDVTKLADTNDGACTPGSCSLRDAVIAANAEAGPNKINLTLPGEYKLTIEGANEHAAATGDLNVTKSLTIAGPGAASATINANGIDRIFEVVAGADLTVSGVTLTGASRFRSWRAPRRSAERCSTTRAAHSPSPTVRSWATGPAPRHTAGKAAL